MKKIVKRFMLSIAFLTILPVDFFFSGKEEKDQNDFKSDLSKASMFFPIAGILIGLILAGTNFFLKYAAFNALLSNGMILVIWILLSGGLHLEGFADMVDGFSGGRNQEEIIKIMKDGAIGAKGAIALILLILLKLLLLDTINPYFKIEALILTPVLGRWAMVFAGYLGKPASSDNFLSQMFTLYLGKKEIIVATIITLAFGFYLLSYQIIYFLFFSGLVTYLISVYAFSRMQGICGDIIGAVNELNEMAILLLFCFL